MLSERGIKWPTRQHNRVQKRPAHPHVCSIRAADLFREFFQVVALRLALDLADRILEGSIPGRRHCTGHGGVSGRALAKRAVGHLEPPNIDKRGGGIDFIPAENDTHPPQSAVGHQDVDNRRQGIQFCHKASIFAVQPPSMSFPIMNCACCCCR